MTVQQQQNVSNVVVFAGGRVTVGKHELRRFPDGEVRIRDIDAAVGLGFSQPRDIRKLIVRAFPGLVNVVSSPAPIDPGRGGNKHRTDEYWLTEAQFLKVVARSETPVADALLDQMIAVFLAVKQHLIASEFKIRHPPYSPRLKPVRRPEIVEAAHAMAASGHSGEQIAVALREQFGVRITGRSVRRWLRRGPEVPPPMTLTDSVTALQAAQVRIADRAKSLESLGFFVDRLVRFVSNARELAENGKLDVVDVIFMEKTRFSDGRVADRLSLCLDGRE